MRSSKVADNGMENRHFIKTLIRKSEKKKISGLKIHSKEGNILKWHPSKRELIYENPFPHASTTLD